jgi:hypothetical protein
MTEFYLDIETEGTDPQQDRILTIQWQQLEAGAPVGELTILKEWEEGEAAIVKRAVDKGILDPGWDFVPVGSRLRFDLTFLVEKAQKYDLVKWTTADVKRYFFGKPTLDLGPVLVLMNEGKFKGSGLDSFTKKTESGAIVPVLYNEGKYGEIVDYVKDEAEAVLELLEGVKDILSVYGRARRGMHPP